VIEEEPKNVSFPRLTRISRLVKALGKPEFRHAYMARQLKAFLADQIRALRGDLTQSEFGDRIGKPQSVISRLEKQADRQISIQTLIDIAKKLDIAIIIRFVDFPTFLRYTEDYSDEALTPRCYDQGAIVALVSDEERREGQSELLAALIQRQTPYLSEEDYAAPRSPAGSLPTTGSPMIPNIYIDAATATSDSISHAQSGAVIELSSVRQVRQNSGVNAAAAGNDPALGAQLISVLGAQLISVMEAIRA
jgi:transcriptional regulator with XRE-family HTH domain